MTGQIYSPAQPKQFVRFQEVGQKVMMGIVLFLIVFFVGVLVDQVVWAIQHPTMGPTKAEEVLVR